MRKKLLLILEKRRGFEFLLMLLALILSFWLMYTTFSSKNSTMIVAVKAWSDFASHIPLIRSFSFGDNIPPQYPLFPGEPIRYHFLFYAFVGGLEKLGIPIDAAFNIPSALSFFFLLLAIYGFAQYLFKKRLISVMAVVFFLFNGSFSFTDFFTHHPLSMHTLEDIVTNQVFYGFFPYDRSSLVAGGFWNLNVFTNQRHLASALALFLFSFLVIVAAQDKKRIKILPTLIIGALLGLLPFWNGAVLLMAGAVLGTYVLFSVRSAPYGAILALSLMALFSLPQLLLLRTHSESLIRIAPGYLIQDQLSVPMFLKFWFVNFGLHSILIPIGIFFSSWKQKKIFLCFFSLFIIGNIFQFSPDIAANHKLFNLFIIVGGMFSAYALVRLGEKMAYFRFLIPIIILFLMFSGIIDFFAIRNDRTISLSDYPNNPDVAWIVKNTPKRSVFLNSSFIYDQASLAGRPIYLGWPYFPWSLGYDTNTRGEKMKEILAAPTKTRACQLATQAGIDYIELEKRSVDDPNFPPVSQVFSDTFFLLYSNPSRQYSIYGVKESCSKNIH